MSDEVKPEVKKDPRRTTVTKIISRKYNLGNYESIDISTSTTDDISWETPEERQKKIASLDKLLLDSHLKMAKATAEQLKIPYLNPESSVGSSAVANIKDK